MAVGDAHVVSWLSHTSTYTSFFKSHRLLFGHASEVRGKDTLERKFTSTWYQTHYHQVTEPPGRGDNNSLFSLNNSLFSLKTAEVKKSCRNCFLENLCAIFEIAISRL